MRHLVDKLNLSDKTFAHCFHLVRRQPDVMNQVQNGNQLWFLSRAKLVPSEEMRSRARLALVSGLLLFTRTDTSNSPKASMICGLASQMSS